MKEERGDLLGSYSFWMALCCLIPLLGIIILSIFGVLGTWGFYALILLCPILHFIFMKIIVSRNLSRGSSRNQKLDGE